jgi:hypothetical protein
MTDFEQLPWDDERSDASLVPKCNLGTRQTLREMQADRIIRINWVSDPADQFDAV